MKKKLWQLVVGIAVAAAFLAPQVALAENTKTFLKKAVADSSALISTQGLVADAVKDKRLLKAEAAKPGAPAQRITVDTDTQMAAIDEKTTAYKEFNGRYSLIALQVDRVAVNFAKGAGIDYFDTNQTGKVADVARIAAPDQVALQGGLGALRTGRFDEIGGGTQANMATPESLTAPGINFNINQDGANVS